jgi:hypothetical protein
MATQATEKFSGPTEADVRSGGRDINAQKRRIEEEPQRRDSRIDLGSCWVFAPSLRIVMSSIMRRRNGLMAWSVMEVLLS